MELIDRCVIQFLLLRCCEIGEICGISQPWSLGRWRCLVSEPLDSRGWERVPAPLISQMREPVELHWNPLDQPAQQCSPQRDEGLGMELKRLCSDGNHKEWQALASPMSLQQVKFIDHGFHQLARVIGQVADRVFQHSCAEADRSSVAAVKAGRFLGFDSLRRLTTEREACVLSQLAQLLI